ncbi:MAG TPA: hypothetical protein VG796_08080 [Verrucomicrobiales bacterium]|nr:hypothetical protein [Verrucomicrobiales bacterium]
MKKSIAVLFLLTRGALCEEALIEMYPEDVAQTIIAIREDEKKAEEELPIESRGLFYDNKRWERGATVRVAFLGGTTALHKKIAETAVEWTKYANLKFDFGYDEVTNTYRSWSPTDVDYVAEIRVAFDLPGYYSAIGTDSVHRRGYPPNKRSMNFGGFDRPNITDRWKGTVLHEFGHALGFAHEHQHKKCHNEIRWERGPKGEPSVFDVMLRDYKWPEKMARLQMATIEASGGEVLGHNPDSVMHYDLSPDAFLKGKKSPCCVPFREKLSDGDKKLAILAYPKAGSSPTLLAQARLQKAIKDQQALTEIKGSSRQAVERAMGDKIAELSQKAKPRVMFFVSDDSQRKKAEEISVASNKSFAPLAITIQSQKKGAFRPEKIEVRYLRNPEDRKVAEQMLAVIEGLNIKNARVSYTERGPAPEKAGDIEVWFSKEILISPK